MYYVIAGQESWQDVVTVSEPAAQELKSWLNHVEAFNGFAIRRKFLATAIEFNDVSDSDFCGYTAIVGDHKSVGHWGEFEAALSSTFRDLKAILLEGKNSLER